MVLSAHFNIYIYTSFNPFTHSDTQSFTEVLKSSQCTLLICFLFHYIIDAAATVAIAAAAGGGAGSVNAVTQTCWYIGARSLCRFAGVLFRLRAVVRVLRSPGGAAHSVDFCEEAGPGLVLCIVL